MLKIFSDFIFYCFVFQAQQLFQKDSKIITPEALATVKAAIANSEKDKKVDATKKAVPRKAAGQSWEDPTLADWPESKISNSLLSFFTMFCKCSNSVGMESLTWQRCGILALIARCLADNNHEKMSVLQARSNALSIML
jgi:hypothetical protein